MFMVAKEDIPANSEIFVQYGHAYWGLTEKEYNKRNYTDEIIHLENLIH
jgi:hypothetical protein